MKRVACGAMSAGRMAGVGHVAAAGALIPPHSRAPGKFLRAEGWQNESGAQGTDAPYLRGGCNR